MNKDLKRYYGLSDEPIGTQDRTEAEIKSDMKLTAQYIEAVKSKKSVSKKTKKKLVK